MEVRSAALRQVSFRAVGWLAVIAMLAVAVLGPSAPRALAGTTITNPEGNNPSCSDFGYAFEFKIDSGDLVAATYGDGVGSEESDVVSNWPGQQITLSNISGGGQVFDWSSTIAVSAVLVKAGSDNHALYTYDPAVTSDTGLTHGDSQQGISHVSFCGNASTPSEPPSNPPSEPPSNPPSEPPSNPPSEPPSAPPSEEPEPNEALVLVLKLVDVDGDLETTDDQFEAEGWEFVFDVGDGTITDEQTVTDEDGLAGFVVEFMGDSLGVSVTEVLQEDWELLDAWCVELEQEELSAQALTETEIPTSLDGAELSFDVEADAAYGCIFVNTSGEVDIATGTPAVTPGPTLPPTDLDGNPAPVSDTWRMALIALAGLLASVLVMTPARSARRR